jgi:hypothetical protein
MGWVEPGYDMHGTQRMTIQTGTRVLSLFATSSSAVTKCGRLGQNGCDLFGLAVAIGGP